MGADNVIFASEMIGAVKAVDPLTDRYFDDTKPYVDAAPGITDEQKSKIFQDNALRAYPRLRPLLDGRLG